MNVVSYAMVEQMNVAAAPWEHGVSEFEKAGFTPVASDLVKPLGWQNRQFKSNVKSLISRNLEKVVVQAR